MKQDVFEYNDATHEIVKKAVENRELDNATESLKNDAEESLDSDFHQFNFDKVLRERDTVVKSIQQVLSPKLDAFEKWNDKIEDRNGGLEESSMDSDFVANKQDNAVDWSDYQKLWENYERLRDIHSLTTIWAFVAHANSNDVAKAVDIRQMQADQNKAMELVNENFDGIENMLDSMAKEMRDGVMRGMEDALESVFSDKDDEIKDLKKKNEELREKLEEAENQGADIDDPKPLSPKQGELADLVQDNPEKDEEWLSEQLDTPVSKVRQLESQIQGKGYKFSID